MNFNNFFVQLGVLSAATAIVLFLLNQIDAMQPYRLFSWICLLFFVLFTVAMYVVGNQSAQSSNKNEFTNTVIGFMVGKMIMAGMIVVLYNKLALPESKFFILPFFVVYVIFTTFETMIMMRLGKEHA